MASSSEARLAQFGELEPLWHKLQDSVRWPMIPPQANRDAPKGMQLRAILGSEASEIGLVQALFATIFPHLAHYEPFLAMYAEPFSRSHPATLDHLWLIEHNGKPVGVRMFSYLYRRNFGHGAFIGIDQQVRGTGIGRWLVQATHQQLALDALYSGNPAVLGYSAEVTRVEDGLHEGDRQEREARLRFHLNNGAVLLPVEYIEPPVIKNSDEQAARQLMIAPQPMHLVFYPSQQQPLKLTTIQAIVQAIYHDIYYLDHDNPFVQHALASLR
ncbi:GNAT family N-acetyltransferase [Herpetosiphon giganteus]|uniref:GNAT family N-acetyltransferase n=1 Tax=Herpetosiphon giganteus TaxID=2029754 RepID=UPI001956E1F9|nr:GNAT family N-acetyltransferase [Herpetosiphon giganteus]MBM7842570.1 GNAT superfamily N-acetyltransferase [Herpetosiphon giganteus]